METQTQELIKKVKHGLDSIEVFEVTDYELNELLKGYSGSIFFNMAIFFCSIATSFVIALLTADVSDRIFNIFTIVIIVSYVASTILFIIWKASKKSISQIIAKIKSRGKSH